MTRKRSTTCVPVLGGALAWDYTFVRLQHDQTSNTSLHKVSETEFPTALFYVNYITTTLQSIAGKTRVNVLRHRMSAHFEGQLLDQQSSLKSITSCTDAVPKRGDRCHPLY